MIDWNADLDRDRQRLEMNRFLKGKNGAMTDCGELSGLSNADSAVSDRLTFPSVQIQGNFGKESRKCRLKRSNKTCKDSDSETSLLALCGIAGICSSGGKRQEAQGRPGEALEMNSALGQAVSNPNTGDVSAALCAKGKEEKKGKNLIRGWKRERDAVRTRREKHNDGRTSPVFNSLPEHVCAVGSRENPCHCADDGMGDITKNALDCGIKGGSAIVVRKNDDTSTPSKKQRTEKVSRLLLIAND